MMMIRLQTINIMNMKVNTKLIIIKIKQNKKKNKNSLSQNNLIKNSKIIQNNHQNNPLPNTKKI